MVRMTSIVLFRQDLRLADNPALAHAASKGPVVGLYVIEGAAPDGNRSLGGASQWWLHHSLVQLKKSLESLIVTKGDPLKVIPEIAGRLRAQGVYWNRCYEPYAIARDTKLKSELSNSGYDVASFNGSLLFEPWEQATQAGTPFKVYSAFWRSCLRSDVPTAISTPKITAGAHSDLGEPAEDWELLPTKPNWAKGFDPVWQPGEVGARQRLATFLQEGLKGYGDLRNRPDLKNVSRLSPHLHFGEISPRQIWAATTMHAEQNPASRPDADKFLSEIGWREFSYHLLYHFPELPEKNWKSDFDAYPWVENASQLQAWQRGMTGYPIVDAGMRELWSTGYMHNRVRMVAASFLVKHLRIHWRHGEAWFWDTLLDADLANNSASWQWVTGSGADAAPYFRIFNPITQGRKFDPDGVYVSRWCPELAQLPKKFIHAPFETPDDILDHCGVILGQTYPKPIVDHATARTAALGGYKVARSLQ